MKRIILLLLALASIVWWGCSRKASPRKEAELQNGEFTAVLNGFDISYVIHGKGPVCMVVPNSWGISREGLRVLFRPLEEHLTMVYFDPRGIGGSGEVRTDRDMSMAAVREDLDALRTHLGLEKAHAIGWSNGAMNLLLFAAEHPEALSSAIVVHGIASYTEEDQKVVAENHPDFVKKYGEFMAAMSQGGLSDEEKEARYREFMTIVAFPSMLADPSRATELLDPFFRDAGFSFRHAWYSETVDAPDFDARDELALISAPTLVIAGAHDMLLPSKVEEVAKGITDSKFVVFEESGHFAPLEEPGKFVDVVLEFVRSGS